MEKQEVWTALKKGQKVTVYYDPLTEQEVEEENVKLLVFRYSGGYFNDRKISYWTVQFSDRMKCQRKILEPEVKESK